MRVADEDLVIEIPIILLITRVSIVIFIASQATMLLAVCSYLADPWASLLLPDACKFASSKCVTPVTYWCKQLDTQDVAA